MAQLIRARSIGDGSGCYGQIFVNERNLSEVMISAGYCQNRPVMGKSNPMGKGPANDAIFPDAPGPMLMGQSGFPGGGGGGGGGNMKRDRNTMSPLNQASILPQSQHLPNMGFPVQVGG